MNNTQTDKAIMDAGKIGLDADNASALKSANLPLPTNQKLNG